MSLVSGCHVTPILLLIGDSEELGRGERTFHEASQSGEGQPGMSLVLGCHMIP
jgi:hypothetical protein